MKQIIPAVISVASVSEIVLTREVLTQRAGWTPEQTAGVSEIVLTREVLTPKLFATSSPDAMAFRSQEYQIIAKLITS